jgi:hypothetical protein
MGKRLESQIAANRRKMTQMFYHLFPQCFTKHGKWGNIGETFWKKWGNIFPLRDKKRDVRNYKQKMK